MKTRVLVICLAALVSTAALAQSKPDGKSSKPSVSGPGTQTEDDLYVGTKPKAKEKNTATKAGTLSKDADAEAKAQEEALAKRLRARDTGSAKAQ